MDIQTNVILSIQTDTGDAEQSIDGLKSKIKDIAKGLDVSSFKTIKQEVSAAKLEMEQLAAAILKAEFEAQQIKEEFGQTSDEFKASKVYIQELNTRLDETVETTQALEDGYKQFLANVKSTSAPADTLKSKLKEAKLEAERLAVEFGEAKDQAAQIGKDFGRNSEQFKAATARVKELETELGKAKQSFSDLREDYKDFNTSVENSDPGNKFRSLAALANGAIGAIQGVTGALALFGGESEETAKTVQKLQGVINIIGAIDSFQDMTKDVNDLKTALLSSSVVQKTLAISTNLTTKAFQLFGISVTATSTAFKALRASIIATGIGALIVGIGFLVDKISSWVSSTDKQEEAQNRLNAALEAQEDILNRSLKSIDIVERQRIARAKIAGKTEAEIRKEQDSAEQERLKTLESNYKRIQELSDDETYTKKLGVEDRKKLNDDEVNAYRKYIDAVQESDTKNLERQGKDAEDLRAKRKQQGDKATEDLKRRIEEEKKAFLDGYKSILDATDSFNKEMELIGLSDRDKEYKQLEQNYRDNVKAIDESEKAIKKLRQDYSAGRVALSKKELKDLQDAENAVNNSRITASDKFNLEKGELDKKYAKEYQLFLEENRDIELDVFEKKKSDINKSIDEAIKQFPDKIKELNDLRKQLLESTNTEQNLTTNVTRSEVAVNRVETSLVGVKKSDFDSQLKLQKELYSARVDNENEQYRLDIERAKGNQEEIEKLTSEHLLRLAQLNKDNSDAEKEIDEKRTEAKLNQLRLIGQAANAASEIFGENTVASKAISVAGATIDTYQSTVSAYKAGVAAFPGPGALAAGAAFAAVAAAAGLASIKKIVSTKIPTKSGGDSGAFGGINSVNAPTISSTQLQPATPVDVNNINQLNQRSEPIRAYITNTDLQTNQQKTNFLNSVGSF